MQFYQVGEEPRGYLCASLSGHYILPYCAKGERTFELIGVVSPVASTNNNVYCSFNHNSKNWKQLIHQQEKKLINFGIFINIILLNNKKECTSDICNNMAKSQKCYIE